MDTKFGLFGGGWQDYHDAHIKPVLDDLDRQIDDIQFNGIGGQLARMQVMNDGSSGRGATDMFSANGAYTGPQIWAAMPGAIRLQGRALLENSGPAGQGSSIVGTPSLDDAARSEPFNMRDSDLAAIRRRSDIQQGVQLAASILAGPVAERLLPELGVAKRAAHIVGKAIDAYDGVRELTGLDEKEKFEQAYQQVVFNRLNNMMLQRSLSASTPTVVRGFIP